MAEFPVIEHRSYELAEAAGTTSEQNQGDSFDGVERFFDPGRLRSTIRQTSPVALEMKAALAYAGVDRTEDEPDRHCYDRYGR